MLTKVIVALFGLGSSYYLTHLCVKYFPKLNHLMDTPSARKKHKNVTPTSGGIVIALLLIILSILYYLYSHDHYILYFIIALITLSFISFLDDIKHLGVLIRLPFHFLTAWLALKSLGVIQVPQLYFIPQNILDFLMLIGMVYFINIYNFMDGIDGSNSSEAIHISISFLFIACIFLNFDNNFSVFIAILLCFACLGFLFHNWSPAKIFLGDIGSTILGLVCGWLMIILGKSGYLAAAMIIPGYYIADSTITLVRRMVKRERFWEPHTQHFFQIATRNAPTHAVVTKKIIKYNAILCLLSIASVFYPRTSIILAILIVSRLLLRFKSKEK